MRTILSHEIFFQFSHLEMLESFEFTLAPQSMSMTSTLRDQRSEKMFINTFFLVSMLIAEVIRSSCVMEMRLAGFQFH